MPISGHIFDCATACCKHVLWALAVDGDLIGAVHAGNASEQPMYLNTNRTRTALLAAASGLCIGLKGEKPILLDPAGST